MDQLSYDCFITDTAGMSRSRDGGRDALLLAARLRNDAASAPRNVRVRNLSRGGLMAEFAGNVAVDETVEIEVHGIGWVKGRVAWIAEGRVGIAFEEQIDPSRVEAAQSAQRRS